MTHGSWPDAVSFEPDDGGARYWEEALAAEERPRGLMLISGEAARYSGWSARAVIALADALAARGPVIVADLHFEQPELDSLVAERNAEGVADAVLFGASLDRVVRPVDGHRFEVVPAGGPVADPESVLRSQEWSRIVEEVDRRDATLILYVPWRARGIEAVGRHIERSLMLGGNTDARLASGYLPPEFAVTAMLSPATPRVGTPPPTAAAMPPASSTPPLRAMLQRPGVRIAAGAAIVVLAAVLVGAFFLGNEPAPAPTASAAPPPAPATATGAALPFAVSVEAHPELFTAAMRTRELAGQDSATGFFLAPLLVDSVLYYRVMAGPVTDSAQAASLMERLLASGAKTGGSEYDIRHAPLAFDLGVYGTRAAADARATELITRLIPAYVLAVPYSDGTVRYHVYCGAWAGPAEADVMRQVLEAAAINATLVQRIGRPRS